jgi:hypothetical protein
MSHLPNTITGDSGLGNNGPLVFDDERGYQINCFSADQLNAIAAFAFQASRPLFELGRQGVELTLSPEELMRLGNHFEEIAFQLGDGVLFDA